MNTEAEKESLYTKLSLIEAETYAQELERTLAVFEKLKSSTNKELTKSLPKSIARTKYTLALIQTDIINRRDVTEDNISNRTPEIALTELID